MLIGEVSERSGVSPRMLRHYDSLGLVRPTGRTAAGYRTYSPADLGRLLHVEGLRSLGLSLAEVRRALDDPDTTPADLVDQLATRTQQMITEQQELLGRLRQVQASDPARWVDALRIVALLRGLSSADPARRQTTALSTAGDEAPSLAGALARALLVEPDESVAGALRWALRRTGDDTALDVLAPALDDPEPDVRRRAVVVVAELSGERADAVLGTALHSADQTVRHRAARALGARGDRRALPVLRAMVVSGDDDVGAAETMAALAQRHGLAASVVDELAREIADRPDDAGARTRLTEALAELPSDLTRSTLEALTCDPDRQVAYTATSVLSRPAAEP